jgi:hypothetical protein
MALFVVLIGAMGAIWPQTLTWVGPYIPWLLGVVMFGMGMTLTFQDFKTVFHRPWEVMIGVVAQFLIMPFVAWMLVKIFSLPPELAIGVILVGTCPGGTASNVISYLAKGDVALSGIHDDDYDDTGTYCYAGIDLAASGCLDSGIIYSDDDFHCRNGLIPSYFGTFCPSLF